MPTFHPIYGDLITAKEVSNLTGFTMNQLRNWRTDSRSHLAPFGSIQIGATSFYRTVVVQDWLDENGEQNGVYRMTDRDKKFPLNVSVEGDIRERQALTIIAGINPETVNAYFEKFSKQSESLAMKYMNSVKNEFLREELGPDWNREEDNYLRRDRFQKPLWYMAATKAMRLLANELQGLGLTREEILAVPVGVYPPINEVKKV